MLAERWYYPLCTDRFLPNLKGLSTQNPIVDRLHQVAAKAKQIMRESVHDEKTLGLLR